MPGRSYSTQMLIEHKTYEFKKIEIIKLKFKFYMCLSTEKQTNYQMGLIKKVIYNNDF